jgi:outer membrane protein
MKYLLLSLGTLLALPAQAQEDPILIGAALRARPAYDGSRARRVDVVPVLRYYGQPWFARTTQGMLEGGIRDELAPQFWAGAQLAYEAGRKKSESAFLADRNVPDLDAGVSAGLHLEWDRKFGPAPTTFLIRARQHLDGDRGGQADLRVTAGIFSRGGFVAALFGQVTWGSEAAVRSLYGPSNSGCCFSARAFWPPTTSAAIGCSSAALSGACFATRPRTVRSPSARQLSTRPPVLPTACSRSPTPRITVTNCLNLTM